MGFLTAHLFWLWLYAALSAVSLGSLLWMFVVVMRAYDAGYDPNTCERRQPRVDLNKALRRRISWPWLGFPLWLVMLALFTAHFYWLSTFTYAVIGLGWFLAAPLRKMWGIAVARRVYTLAKGETPRTSYWHDVANYYGAGFKLPSKPAEAQWFPGKLRWLNGLQKVWYILQLWRLWGVGAQVLASLVWPVAAFCAVFYHMEEVDEYEYRQCPWWRWTRSNRPTIDGTLA